MKTLLTLILFFSVTLNVISQKKKFTQCNTRIFYKLNKNDTVTINCDTAYIFSSTAYRLFFNAGNGSLKEVKEIVKLQKEYLENCEQEVKIRQNQYDLLKIKFDSLSEESLKTAKSVSDSLEIVNRNLSDVKGKIESSQAALLEATNYIKKEKKTAFLKRVGWGIGGFAAGILTSLIFLSR